MQQSFATAFEDEDYIEPPVKPVVRTTTPTVGSTIGAPRRAKPTDATDLLATPGASWTAEQLRAYVERRMAETSRARITLPSERVMSIFKSFVKRHPDARQLAEFAFEGQLDPGWWNSAPITPYNFCIKSDPHFAAPIRAKLAS